jgi:hypothetical protein
MCPSAQFIFILLCLTPANFTCQGEMLVIDGGRGFFVVKTQ